MKGAPEQILARCETYFQDKKERNLNEEDLQIFQKVNFKKFF